MALGLERSSIPLVTGPDYKPQPVMANLPDQKPDDIQLVSFEPDAPAEAPAPAKAPGGNFITDAARVIGMGALGLGQMAGNLAYAGTNSSGLKTVADKLGEWSSDLHSGLTPGMKVTLLPQSNHFFGDPAYCLSLSFGRGYLFITQKVCNQTPI